MGSRVAMLWSFDELHAGEAVGDEHIVGEVGDEHIVDGVSDEPIVGEVMDEHLLGEVGARAPDKVQFCNGEVVEIFLVGQLSITLPKQLHLR